MIIPFERHCIFLFWWLNWKVKKEKHPTSNLTAFGPEPSVYVSTSCHILVCDRKKKQGSIFNIFGIGSHTAVKTERWSQVRNCVYCKHSLQTFTSPSLLCCYTVKAPRGWHFGVSNLSGRFVLVKGIFLVTDVHTFNAEIDFVLVGMILCPHIVV